MRNATRTASGCLESMYSRGSHGYAQIGWNEPGYAGAQMLLAHRAVWQAINGPIPEGMTVDHMCHNRVCVEIAHMRLLTNFENARRTAGRDWPLGECVNGHGNEHLKQYAGHTNCSICRSEWRTQRPRRSA